MAGVAAVALSAQTPAQFFDDSVLHDIWLEINPADWAALKANFMENTYYRCHFSWNTTTVRDVGVRSRGRGSRSGVKPSLLVDFPRYQSSRRFLGLRRVVLRNLIQDPPLLRERLAFKLFERLGFPASREAFARLHVNGEYAGLYLMVEPIDAEFLQSRFGQSNGYLYEYNWLFPYNFEDLGPDAAQYSPDPFEPKTNEKNPDPYPLVEMIRTANHSRDEDFIREMSVYLDLKKFAAYLAVENYIAETDGLLGDAGLNNFYLYRFAGTRRFEFLPWDKNATFAQPEHSIWYNVGQNVLVRRLLAVPEMKSAYLGALWLCAKTAGGAGGWLEGEAVRLYNQIRTAARQDALKPQSNDEFETAVNALLWFIRERELFVQDRLRAEGFVAPR